MINTATYGWAKFFVPLVRRVTLNNYTIKDSFEFVNGLQHYRLFMESLDTDSIFTNIPLEETLNIC